MTEEVKKLYIVDHSDIDVPALQELINEAGLSDRVVLVTGPSAIATSDLSGLARELMVEPRYLEPDFAPEPAWRIEQQNRKPESRKANKRKFR